ncbi:MmcQ/YjbR family DNA-binding protein [Nocardioides sp. CFH 31398]|uniref:MmcQ/YjbR family DNA-binding protein n=1 Tax=Nocardioides sp. CFH 31398 TaxID=2919579 RepID=UPI001F05C045|nr:MmcQ/YjbR family DNA-binding protein [Nocardioides sp. CFH 31398]MCH1867333.1 MmcQ/YjbR family DNA-binding protein [Nocardioides sp. CFH 31398]
MAHDRMYDDADPLLTRLRELALALPEAYEKEAWGRPTFRAGKIFAIYGGGVKVAPGDHEPHDRAVLVKPEPGEVAALDEDPRFFVPAYYGPFGWRGLDLDGEDVDWTEVAELLDASFRQVASRSAVKELDSR